jgi:hypothetical protein
MPGSDCWTQEESFLALFWNYFLENESRNLEICYFRELKSDLIEDLVKDSTSIG